MKKINVSELVSVSEKELLDGKNGKKFKYGKNTSRLYGWVWV